MPGRYFFIWRLLIFIPLIIGIYFIPVNASSPVSYIFDPLFPWANFDGIHYLNIARDGYTNQARFFPLFPLVLKITSNSILASSILVSMIFFLSLWIFKKLIELDFSREISQKSIAYLLIFPTSFFFVCIYSEGLFLLLTVLAFYFARKKKWLLSVIFAALLMTTRFVGIAILPALLYEYFTSEESLRATIRGGFSHYKKLALFFIAPLGLVAYSVFNYFKWHNFLNFVAAQGELGNNRSVSSIVLFPQTIFRYINILSTVPVSLDWGVALLELSAFLFVAFLLYFAWKKKIRTSYQIFAFVNFGIIISTGTFSGLPRYILTLFPLFIVLALIKNRLFKIIYFILSSIVLFILLMLFSRGYFIA